MAWNNHSIHLRRSLGNFKRNSLLWHQWVIYPVKPFLNLFNWGMPDITGDVVSFCKSHFSSILLIGKFLRKIGRLRSIWRRIYDIFSTMSITWRGPTPWPPWPACDPLAPLARKILKTKKGDGFMFLIKLTHTVRCCRQIRFLKIAC